MIAKIDLTKYYHWHWSIKLVSIALINLSLSPLLFVAIIKPTLTKQSQIQNSIMLIQQRIHLRQMKIATLTTLQQTIKKQQQYYCKLAGDNIIYPIADANLLINIKIHRTTDSLARANNLLRNRSQRSRSHKASIMTMSATGSLESLYYFLEALSLKQPQLTWQQLTISPGKKASQYHLTLYWIPLSTDICNTCPEKKSSTIHSIFPNQPGDSLMINGYFNNNGQQQVFIISDRAGKSQTISRGDRVAIENIGIEKLVAAIHDSLFHLH